MAKGNKALNAQAAVADKVTAPAVQLEKPTDGTAKAVTITGSVTMPSVWSEQDTAQLKTDLLTFKKNLTDFKVEVHQLAYRTLVHAHNTGDLSLVKQFYDILDEDKLLRKSAFAKWVQMYAPARFDEESKKFFKDVSPDRIRFFYHEDADIGGALLAGANAKRFWDIPGGEEKVNPTIFDVMALQTEKILERIKREAKAGKYDAETAEERSVREAAVRELSQVLSLVTPMTSKEQALATTSVKPDVKDAEMVDVTQEKAA